MSELGELFDSATIESLWAGIARIAILWTDDFSIASSGFVEGIPRHKERSVHRIQSSSSPGPFSSEEKGRKISRSFSPRCNAMLLSSERNKNFASNPQVNTSFLTAQASGPLYVIAQLKAKRRFSDAKIHPPPNHGAC